MKYVVHKYIYDMRLYDAPTQSSIYALVFADIPVPIYIHAHKHHHSQSLNKSVFHFFKSIKQLLTLSLACAVYIALFIPSKSFTEMSVVGQSQGKGMVVSP